MTREEEIKVSALKYTDNFIPDVCGICEEDIYDAFMAGAKWADEHPNLESLWHDASEMPNNHSYIMLVIDRYTIKTDYIPACLKHCQLNGSNWNEFAKDVKIKKWAYISDLLPKGGEI